MGLSVGNESAGTEGIPRLVSPPSPPALTSKVFNTGNNSRSANPNRLLDIILEKAIRDKHEGRVIMCVA